MAQSVKVSITWAGKTAQHLRAHDVLGGNLGSILSTT